MANLQYIGARYVPIVYTNPDDNSSNWKAGVTYEPLTIVTVNGDSYTSKKAVPDGIGTPQDNPAYWVKTGDFNASLVSLQNRVTSIEEQNGNETLLTNAQTLSGGINELKSDYDSINGEINNSTGKDCIGNLLLNHFYEESVFGHNPQGACYIGNNRIVQYYSSTTSNTGYLICFDLTNYIENWRYEVPCYHGNSVTYNPNTGMLYISGCVTYDSSYVNMIFEIDINNPSTILRTIALPNTNVNYSLTYDAEKDVFYATNNIGTTDGVANKLTVYDSTLTTVLREVTLKNHPAVKYKYSTQGVQLGIDGIAYVLVYSRPYYIAAYDTTSGELVNVYNLPQLLSDYREYYEPEAIMYDSANKRMFVSSVSWYFNLAIEGYKCNNIFEIDAFHGIEYIPALPQENYTSEGEYQTIFYISTRPSFLMPRHLSGNNANYYFVACARDFINICKKYNGSIAVVQATSDIREIYHLRCQGVNAEIRGTSSDHAIIKQLVVYNSNIKLQYCDFVDNVQWASNLYAQLAIQKSFAFLQNCKFTSNNPSASTSVNHIAVTNGSYLITRSVTFEGSYANDVYQTYAMYNGNYQ